MQHTIAAIYIQQMIPAGQMIQLLHQLTQSTMKTNKHRVTVNGRSEIFSAKDCVHALTGPILDTLHLVNLALQSMIACGAAPKFDNTQLVAELDKLLTVLRAALTDDWARTGMHEASLAEAMHKVLSYPRNVAPKLEFPLNFISTLASRIEPVSKILTNIWAELDYSPTTRNRFLRTRLQSAENAPLVKNRKAAYWLTLVRNSPLAPMLAKLDVQLDLRQLKDASYEGTARLQRLLASLPGYQRLHNSENLVGPKATRIPADVSLTVEDGLMVLTRVLPCPVTPVFEEDPAAWTEFAQKHNIELPSADARTLQVTCSVETLGRGLQYLEQTGATMLKEAQQLRARFEQDRKALHHELLVTKLTANLNEEEMQVLAAYFANKK